MTQPVSTDKGSSKNITHWQSHIRAQKSSGLSRAEYCRRHDLSYHALTYWTKKATTLSRNLPGQSLVPVPVKMITSRPALPAGSSLKIILGERLAIEIPDKFSPATLKQVLAILEVQ